MKLNTKKETATLKREQYWTTKNENENENEKKRLKCWNVCTYTD